MYTGKVVIPGDKLDEYIKGVEEAERKRAPFREYLQSLNEEFTGYLLEKYSERTAGKHTFIVAMFIDFLCSQTDVQNIEEITRGMVNTHFKNWWQRKVWSSSTPNDLRVALKKFFRFLAEKKGIVCEKASKVLQ